MRTSVKRFSKSLAAGVTAGALAISGLAVALTASPAGAAASTTVFGGANRYDTARIAAESLFPSGSSEAVLASGENYPDGLAAADVAGALSVPLLLTPAASLAPETVSALATLKVHTVQVVGGTAAVSANVIAQLTGLGYTVPAALAGADRYATSAAVAGAAALSAPIGTVNGVKTAILATGANFPDALAAGSASYNSHLPILLTDPNTLSTSVTTELTALGIQHVIIMGGTSAISTAVETAVQALLVGGVAVTTQRVQGATRYDTAAAMATLDGTGTFSGGFGMSLATIALASGLNFPDALVAAEFKAPTILDGSGLPTGSSTFLTTNAASITLIEAIGGPAAVPAADLAAAQAAVSPSAGAATFAAVAGGTTFSVTFAAPINTPVIGDFVLNNAALTAPAAVAQVGPTTWLVTLAPGVYLRPGDIIGINAGSPPTAVSNGATVPASTFTVPAAANPAVAGVQFFINGTAVGVQFNKPVTAASVAGVTLNGGPLGAPTFTSVDGTTFTWTGKPAIASTAVLTIPTSVVDLSGLFVLSQTTYSPVSNTVAPTISAAVSSVYSATQGTFPATAAGFGLVGSDALTISARPNTAADGAFGGAFQIATTTPTTSGLLVTTATVAGVTTVTISYPAGLYSTGAQIAAALNANAVFASILVANGTGIGPLPPAVATNTATTVVAGVALLGGTTTYNVSAVLSKPIVPTNVTDNGPPPGIPVLWSVSSGAPVVAVTPNNLAEPSVVTVTLSATTAAQAVVNGTTTLSFTASGAAPVVDFANNLLSTQTVTVS